MFVCWLVYHNFLKGRDKLHFHAPIRALVLETINAPYRLLTCWLVSFNHASSNSVMLPSRRCRLFFFTAVFTSSVSWQIINRAFLALKWEKKLKSCWCVLLHYMRKVREEGGRRGGGEGGPDRRTGSIEIYSKVPHHTNIIEFSCQIKWQ